MTRRAPVPLQVRHRRDWRRWWRRRSICGLRWPCLDLRAAPADPPPCPAAAAKRHPGWNAQTVGWPLVGRAGRLTPAQQHRANGGRW